MKIRVLDDVTVNKIAAGEVIDRPASVVRELVDNALDAGADDLAVYVEAGGRTLVRVVDNGVGMSRDDALLAFERHATSKLTAVEDLDTITSYGFRGEALASIAAVSKVRLRTQPKDAPVGVQVEVSGGVLRGVEETVATPGTDLAVGRLFFSTPARRKFLRQPSTELRRIRQWLQHCSLGVPTVRIRLFAEGKEVLHLAPRKNAVDRARDLWKGSMLEVGPVVGGEERSRVTGAEVSVEGLIGHPSMARANQSDFVALVNDRVVTDRMIMKAVREGFLSTLKDREYPVGFISVRLDPAQVDVNVHPQKSEVRFRDMTSVYAAVRDEVARAVERFSAPIVAVETSRFVGRELQKVSANAALLVSSPVLPLEAQDPTAAGARPKPTALEARSPSAAPLLRMMTTTSDTSVSSAQEGQSSGEGQHHYKSVQEKATTDVALEGQLRFSDLEYLGQALQCYLLCQSGEHLVVVDMHAAHERYNFNLVRKSFFEKGLPAQQLLLPLTVEVGEAGVAHLLAAEEFLAKFGIELEAFGEEAVILRAVPAVLSHAKVESLIKELAICEFGAMVEDTLREFVDHVSARIACHASIRAGKRMKKEEVYALFRSLDQSEFRTACPHGRPIVVSFHASAVERWFGRDK